jgi:hypothetical protein
MSVKLKTTKMMSFCAHKKRTISVFVVFVSLFFSLSLFLSPMAAIGPLSSRLNNIAQPKPGATHFYNLLLFRGVNGSGWFGGMGLNV